MSRRSLVLSLTVASALLCPTLAARAQELVVEPFLQSMSTDSTWVVWEISELATSRVRWGTSPDALDQSADATAHPSQGGHQIVEAQLTGLTPGTRYSYRVESGDTVGAVHDFVTPPAPGSDAVIRLVAMSDMQQNLRWPTKFEEIVHDGVIDWASARWGEDLAAELSMVLIPGDLVEVGPDYASWGDTFFAPLQPLSASVPLWPVYGNHEQGTHWFQDYFHLPENGSVAGSEHWWETRYANLLVVGLDSNQIGAWGDQMDWLDTLLTDACEDPTLDFVFAQLHHPYESELWTSGNNPLVGMMIDRLGEFSNTCGKPTVHFFGHTHAYSRGQSRDARHLMVNVASAGGALDRWGEQPQKDYAPFSVSDDDWGFVVVEVTGGADPTLTVRRISRGDADVTEDNREVDLFTLRTVDDPPATPRLTAPGDGVDGACVTLRASDYTDPEGDAQQATHWQVAPTCDLLTTPTYDVWRQDRNLYFGLDTQSQDDLGDETLRGLTPGSWCARVRYRDSGLVWSEWSATHTFTVDQTSATDNLLPDPSAEDELHGWTFDGHVEITGDTRCGAAVPTQGARAIGLGGPCVASGTGAVQVDLNVVDHADRIAAGTRARWRATTQGADGSLRLTFRGANNAELGVETLLLLGGDAWTPSHGDVAVPTGTQAIRVELASDGFAQLDDLELSLGAAAPIDCAEVPISKDTHGPTAGPACGCTDAPGGAWGALSLLALAATLRRARDRS
jgi:hypothetical protein